MDMVPGPGDFELASETFTKLIEENNETGTIDGGFIFGSTARGSSNIRSDFDSLISLADASPRSYKAARAIVLSVMEESGYRVPIGPIVYTKQAWTNGHHEVDRLLESHLKGKFRVVAGNDPADYMTFADATAHSSFESFIYYRQRSLTNSFVEADPLDMGKNSLKRLLELSNSMGRKSLEALADVGYISHAPEASEKPAVFRQSYDLFGQHGLDSGFMTLNAANSDYDTLLQDAINGSVDRDTYNEAIVELFNQLPMAIDWVGQVGRTFLPILNQESE
jgi:hypothetical protein